MPSLVRVDQGVVQDNGRRLARAQQHFRKSQAPHTARRNALAEALELTREGDALVVTKLDLSNFHECSAQLFWRHPMVNKFSLVWAQDKSQILALLLTFLFFASLYLGFAP